MYVLRGDRTVPRLFDLNVLIPLYVHNLTNGSNRQQASEPAAKQ